ncbi:hypothetical protein [Candidatus Lokiarchaeum ossiferum]|uniref:hypothetical protein n=1 Tax=Candidatus Lokiarchaeum ossiferum TaxID=2951803 RepID=UPI00352DA656
MAGKFVTLAKILSIIGGLIMLAIGALGILYTFIDPFFNVPLGWGGIGLLSGLISSIILFAVGIFTFISTGVIKKSTSNVGFNAVTLIVLGIVGLLFGGGLWAILLILAGILMIL